MRFVQQTPFFFLTMALIIGIVIYGTANLPLLFVVILLFVSTLLMSATLFTKVNARSFQLRWTFGVGTFLIFIAFGFLLSIFFEKKSTFSHLNQLALFEVVLEEPPLEKEKSFQFKVRLISKIDSLSLEKASGRAILYVQKEDRLSDLLVGDRLLIRAEFKTPDGVQNPGGFDYASYLTKQGVGATAYVQQDEWMMSNKNPGFSLKRASDYSRRNLLTVYRKYGIVDEQYAVLSALTLGYKDALQPHVKTIYSASGAAHILAVSGLHVGVVYAVAYFVLGFIAIGKRGRVSRGVLATLFIWFYAFITGLSPAVVRAALMLSFVSVAGALERKSRIYNTVFLSAFVMLLFNPNLIFNVSFQLSYAAVLSIVLFQKDISRLYVPKNRLLKWLWGLTAVSIAAQLGTSPITIYYFGQFPLYFLLTNYIAIPMSTGIIYLSLLLLAVSPFEVVGQFLGKTVDWLVFWMNRALEIIVEMPGAVMEVAITSMQLLLLFASATFLLFYIYHKYRTSFLMGLIVLQVFLVNTAGRSRASYKQSELIVFSDSRVSAVNFIEGKKNQIYSTDYEKSDQLFANYWKRSLLKPAEPLLEGETVENQFVTFKGERIMILADDFTKEWSAEESLEVDLLIVTNRMRSNLAQLLNVITPREVVVDKTVSGYYESLIREECLLRKIKYYSVSESGAFVKTF